MYYNANYYIYAIYCTRINILETSNINHLTKLFDNTIDWMPIPTNKRNILKVKPV